MIVVWIAALGATVVVGIVTGLAYLLGRKQPPAMGVVARWALGLWIVNFVLDLAILYFEMPPLTGPYWGGQWLLWPLLVTGVLALFGGGVLGVAQAVRHFSDEINGGTFLSANTARVRKMRARGIVDANQRAGTGPASSVAAGAAALGLVFVTAIIVNGLITVATTWFDPNAHALAAIPAITREPAGTSLPPTDVNHMVLVSRGTAAFEGQQVLAASGQNLGSLYHTVLTEYTLQSIRGHLYYVAPLVYNNVWANLGRWESPGYVVVDAEDPNATPKLRTGYHMRYLPDALFNQDLTRHVYLSGYTNAILADPTLEVDDNWRPYFTLSLMQPTRGFTGEVVKSVLLVDAQTGRISQYAPSAVPAWVDRIIPADTVTEYLTWWGRWAHAPWINPSGSNQQLPAVDANDQPQLIYDTADHPVWLVPMTSSSGQDNSSTGVVLYDTRANAGRFYPLVGLGVTQNVRAILKGSPLNIRDYTPTNIQLYQLYGEPTWVTTFVQPNLYGESFQAIGLLDARHLSGANVIMAPTKSAALAQYAQWLADHNIQTGATPTGKAVTVEGTIERISATTQSGTSVYFFTLAGQQRIFEAGLALSPQLPLAQPGDHVRVTYLDTGQQQVTLTAFDDLTIPLEAPAATPAP